MLGFQLALASWTPVQTAVPAEDEWFRCVEEVWNNAHLRLQRAVHRQKEQANRHCSESPVFHPGDRVWFSTRNLPLRLCCKKLSPWFVETFKVLWRVNEVTYRLQLPSHFRISPSFHVSLFWPVATPPGY